MQRVSVPASWYFRSSSKAPHNPRRPKTRHGLVCQGDLQESQIGTGPKQWFICPI